MKLPIIRAIVCLILLLVPAGFFLSKNNSADTEEDFDYVIKAEGTASADNHQSRPSTVEGELYINTSQEWSGEMYSQTGVYGQGMLQLKQTQGKGKKAKSGKNITKVYYITSVERTDDSSSRFSLIMSASGTDSILYGVPLAISRDSSYVKLQIPEGQEISGTFMLPLIEENAIAVKKDTGNFIYSSGSYIQIPLSGGKTLTNYLEKFYGDSSSIWIPLGLYICFVTSIYLLLSGRLRAFLVVLAGIAISAVTMFMSWTVAVPFIVPFILLCIMLPFRLLRRYMMYVCITVFLLNCLLCIVLFWNEYSFFTFIWKCVYIGCISMLSASFVGFYFAEAICFTCGRFMGNKTYRTNWVYDNAKDVLKADYTRNSRINMHISASNENGKNVCYWCSSVKDV